MPALYMGLGVLLGCGVIIVVVLVVKKIAAGFPYVD